jgi:hypothetical protein
MRKYTGTLAQNAINLHVTHGNLLIGRQVLLGIEVWFPVTGRPPLSRRESELASSLGASEFDPASGVLTV